jgi:hypothetical protein
MAEVKQKKEHRLVFIDLECVPNERVSYSAGGKLAVDPTARNTIQLAACELDGTMIVPEMNINPCIDWKKNESFLGYAAKCWKVKKKEDVPVVAISLPTFGAAIVRAVVEIYKKMGNNVLLVCHNGKKWDIPVIHQQCTDSKVRIVLLHESFGFDTRYILYRLGKPKGSKDRSWSLDSTHKRVFGESIQHAHTAVADVQALARLMREYMRSLQIHKEADFVKHLQTSDDKKGIFNLPWTPMVPPGGPAVDSFVAAVKAEENEDEVRFKRVVEKIKTGGNHQKFKDPELEELFLKMRDLTLGKQ